MPWRVNFQILLIKKGHFCCENAFLNDFPQKHRSSSAKGLYNLATGLGSGREANGGFVLLRWASSIAALCRQKNTCMLLTGLCKKSTFSATWEHQNALLKMTLLTIFSMSQTEKITTSKIHKNYCFPLIFRGQNSTRHGTKSVKWPLPFVYLTFIRVGMTLLRQIHPPLVLLATPRRRFAPRPVTPQRYHG